MTADTATPKKFFIDPDARIFGTQDGDLSAFYQSEFAEHKAVVDKTLAALEDDFIRLYEVCLNAVQRGNKILFFGNGGSAADSQHLATELTVRYKENRPAIPALALTTDTSALTATPNDFSFEVLFSRQIEALGQPGDVALGISTSGKSPNVIKALKVARDLDLIPAALSGKDGGDLIGLANPLLIVPSHTTSRIQEMHITLGQMLCGALEKGLGLVD
ncbi:MAG: D-sedoheptulose 7-phosphate isomerase [Alphaproteobacteria bacterium]|nr:D-sedoheptulose 7-phosphate isomerase [Alphaproteobacteria bacterium]NCP61728.1 D-sedoheptulose 7-phosphate isomerase [Alphaproteobacteria bacterium]NCQ67269.1 D-sedoheptulose 7-phosphate isomerase [Alphaproteobacteria bacterium]NCT06764.1 D-sedoheptulose 7-phosphate isomerase [Alphaproteobacteria bacterium]